MGASAGPSPAPQPPSAKGLLVSAGPHFWGSKGWPNSTGRPSLRGQERAAPVTLEKMGTRAFCYLPSHLAFPWGRLHAKVSSLSKSFRAERRALEPRAAAQQTKAIRIPWERGSQEVDRVDEGEKRRDVMGQQGCSCPETEEARGSLTPHLLGGAWAPYKQGCRSATLPLLPSLR